MLWWADYLLISFGFLLLLLLVLTNTFVIGRFRRLTTGTNLTLALFATACAIAGNIALGLVFSQISFWINQSPGLAGVAGLLFNVGLNAITAFLVCLLFVSGISAFFRATTSLENKRARDLALRLLAVYIYFLVLLLVVRTLAEWILY